jgi:hypothetical protein
VDLVGREIMHDLFGIGKIVAQEKYKITVQFSAKETTLVLNKESKKHYYAVNSATEEYINEIVSTATVKPAHIVSVVNEIESPNRLINPAFPVHNIVSNGIFYPIIVCASTRSFCANKMYEYEDRYHRVEMRSVIVSCLDIDRDVNIAAEYCFDCQSYKIDKISIYMYEEKYGKLILLRREESKPYKGNVSQSSMSWDSATFLAECGYSVKANGMNELQRQRLLSYLIDNEVISLPTVMATIRQAISMGISMNYNRTVEANRKRKNDLDFLENKYLTSDQAISGKLIQASK